MEIWLQDQIKNNIQQNTKEEREQQSITDDIIGFILLFPSEIPGHQNVYAYAYPNGKSQHQRSQRERKGYCGQRFLTDLRYEETVHKIVGILQKHGKQRWQGHLHDKGNDSFRSHLIFLLMIHLILLFCVTFQYSI